ncbi:hypothetical protein ACE193_03790 [Bernardetia sp. OM2101]|uniref:hypothetical protein n=1 Tax=Bernardetia sp. OM2101 TaxID=3344876 RepID=UPI0035CF5FB7
MKKITIIFLSIICFSCSQNSKTEVSSQNFSKDSINQISSEIVEVEKDTLPLFDTTIYIKSEKQKVDSPKSVSRQMVIDDLYAHFKKKNVCIEGHLVGKQTEYNETICVRADTTEFYMIDLNDDNQLDAIVKYWLTPWGASSHCFQPTKSIMINKSGKFFLEYEEFIQDHYFIDSVKTNKEETIIYGYEYFCYDHKVTGYFKVHLKHSH